MADDKLWGGRFKQGTDALVEEYTASVDFDRRLYAQDIAGSKAHVRMLARQGILTGEEVQAIVDGLEQVRHEIESGQFIWERGREDVHMNIESRLIEIVGPAGKKLHTGRSRNDQVALDFRLYVADRLTSWNSELAGLVASLLSQAEKHVETLMPGFTHLQPAQPVSLAHHLLAYVAMFQRDVERIDDALKRIKVSPLGAAALAGTTYPLDQDFVAREVGFHGVCSNSLDAVSDRDFVAESLFIAALTMAHLSRFCEEIILWANPGFGFVALPDAYATGSSIMPQKKNPDVAEIMRGKTGRVYGDLVALLTTIKGLPLAYNRDLQEDKEPFFDADRTVAFSVRIMAEMVKALSFVPARMSAALKSGYLNATELADYLVTKGLPFREAHHATGLAVAYAEEKGVGLEDLSVEELNRFSSLVQDDVLSVLDYRNAVARRQTRGGTGFERVREQIAAAGKWLEERVGK